MALDHGGIFDDTSDEVWSSLEIPGRQGFDSIRIDEAFLRQRMELGADSIEPVNETIEEVFQFRGSAASAGEVGFLEVWGAWHEYTLVGDTRTRTPAQ